MSGGGLRERGGAIGNMSAPPRSTADIRPVRVGAAVDSSAHRSGGPSATFFARVRLPGVLYEGRSDEIVAPDIVRYVLQETPDLSSTVALLRTRRTTGEAREAAERECRQLPTTQLIDEFVDRVAALGDRALPPVLLARRPHEGVPVTRSTDPLTAIRLLAGTAGGLFVRMRTISAEHFLCGLPGTGSPGEAAFDYYLPGRP